MRTETESTFSYFKNALNIGFSNSSADKDFDFSEGMELFLASHQIVLIQKLRLYLRISTDSVDKITVLVR